MHSIAIIGTGIAGMSAAAQLRAHAKLTLFEREDGIGGHTNTVTVTENGKAIPIDTGFMVYNEVTYPHLIKLFGELGVETVATDMSFGMQEVSSGFIWSSNLTRHWQSFFQPQFWRMFSHIIRFNRLAHALLETGQPSGTLRDFLTQNAFPSTFIDRYLLPMTAAIWSTPHDEMLNFPLATLLHFLRNHGLLGLTTQYQWRTVKGGSCQYRERLIAPFRASIVTSCKAISVVEESDRVRVTDEHDRTHTFDAVLIATHADEALGLLPQPSPAQRQLLGAFQYSPSNVLLHSDPTPLPPKRSQWAAWNYRLDLNSNGSKQASTHYWMNKLQHLESRKDYFVSLNAPEGSIDETSIHWRRQYTHPIFNEAAIQAQAALPTLNTGRLYFAGSYFRYGFHEDALIAGQDASNALIKRIAHEAA